MLFFLLSAPPVNPGYERKYIFFYALFSIILIVVIIVIYLLNEKRNQQKLRQKFLKFSSVYQVSIVEKRFAERLNIPSFLKTELMFIEGKFFGLKGTVIDISDSGLAIKPDFPLKKIPLQTTFSNLIVHTPISDILIKRAINVRIEHQPNKRLMGIQIQEISADQQEKLIMFLGYLKGFMENAGNKI